MASGHQEMTLRELNRQLHNLRQNRARGRSGGNRLLPHYQGKVAIAILHHPRGGQSALELYVERQLRQRMKSTRDGAQDRLRENVASEVALCVCVGPQPWRANPETPYDHQCLRAAERFLAEKKVIEWISRANTYRGSAPTSRVVSSILMGQGVRIGQGNRARQWLFKFRRRWRVRHARLKSRPQLDLEYFRCAARVFYQWLDFAASRVPVGRRLVWINFDESSIPFAFKKLQGYITRSSARDPQLPNAGTERLAQSADRGSYTLLGFISNHADIQRRLPCILIGKAQRLTRRIMEGRRAKIVDGLEVWANQGSWVNQEVMLDILRRLAHCVQDVHSEIYPILVLDCAPQHISSEIVDFAHALGFELVFVPKHLTWLLQPLDVMVFQRLKHDLRELWTEERAHRVGGQIDVETHLSMIARCVRPLFETGQWARAFDFTGITSGRRHLNSTLERLLDSDMRDVSSDPPTPAQLQFISNPRHLLPHEALIRRAPILAPLAAQAHAHRPLPQSIPRARRLHGLPALWREQNQAAM